MILTLINDILWNLEFQSLGYLLIIISFKFTIKVFKIFNSLKLIKKILTITFLWKISLSYLILQNFE